MEFLSKILWIPFLPTLLFAQVDHIERVGTVEITVEDYLEGPEVQRVFLEDSETSEPIPLAFSERKAASLAHGDKISVRGEYYGGQFVVSDYTLLENTKNNNLISMGQTGGVQNRATLVVIVDFANRSVACTQSGVESLVFSGTPSLAGLYEEASSGNLQVESDLDSNGSSDVFRVSLSENHEGSCTYRDWQSLANTELEKAGVSAADYDQKFYVIPFVDQVINETGEAGRDYNDDVCWWAGIASGTSTVTLNRCELPDVYIHEMGHNLGLQHAAIDLDDNGERDEGLLADYLDHSDFMGEAAVGWRQLNGPHKLHMGWLSESKVIDVSLEDAVTLEIGALEVPEDQNSLPRIVRLTIPSSDQAYYVSYRSKQSEVDQDLKEDYDQKTSIHRYPYLSRTLFVQALADGEVFRSGEIDFSVKQVSHDLEKATIQIGSAEDVQGEEPSVATTSGGCETMPARGCSSILLCLILLVIGKTRLRNLSMKS